MDLSQVNKVVRSQLTRAETKVTMVFKNETDKDVEGELIVPLPEGKSLFSKFNFDSLLSEWFLFLSLEA